MKNETLYNKTVDILVNAYFNDTLKHGDYCGCAVGNIIAQNNGFCVERVVNRDFVEILWNGSDRLGGIWHIDMVSGDFTDLTKSLIAPTGYTWDQIISIENAFEAATWSPSDEDRMFNGLMNVIEVLDQIHENTDTAITEQSKARFVKAAA